MTDADLEAFLAGELTEHVALFLDAEYLDDGGKLAAYGERVEGGVVLVVPGEEGRQLFSRGTGHDAMTFAGAAMDREGDVARDLSGGICPDEGDGQTHAVQFVLAFAEAENEDVGGRYAEGDVVHAYAHCECGTNFSEKWIADAEAGG